MTAEVEQFLLRREAMLKDAAKIIKSNAPLLSDSAARDVTIIALKSWQDLRKCWDWQEAGEFINSL